MAAAELVAMGGIKVFIVKYENQPDDNTPVIASFTENRQDSGEE